MYPILHKAGFASQPTAIRREDGPPAYRCIYHRCCPLRSAGNKPSPEEIGNCATFLDREFAALTNVKVVVVLGKIGVRRLSELPETPRGLEIQERDSLRHGETYKLPNGRTLLCSYHPSLQNTLTGK